MISVFLYSLSISIDAFSIALGYGIRGVRFLFFECILTNLLNVSVLYLSACLSNSIKFLCDEKLLSLFGCFLLLFIGFYDLFEFFTNKKDNNFRVKNVFVENKNTFVNNFKNIISILPLLCVESFVAGLGLLVYSEFGLLLPVFFSFVFHTLFLYFGCLIGKKLNYGGDMDLSWFSGIVFVILAIFKFFE